MGMVGFYARFIPGYSDVAAALHSLKRKGVPFVWAEEQQKAFDRLKRALCEWGRVSPTETLFPILLLESGEFQRTGRFLQRGI